MYEIIYSPKAKDDLRALQRYEPAAFRKAAALIEELKTHPRTGTGKPEPLSFDTEVHVDVLSAYGHYGDK